jgi:hypothetical protein
MRLHTMAIAMMLAAGCAPAAPMVNAAVRGDPEVADCGGQHYCQGTGGSASVAIPLLIAVVAITTPALIHHQIFRNAK